MRKRYHTHHEWLHGRVVGLIGRQLLQKAEDRAAAFWEMAIDGIDEARLKKALTNLFGKEEGEKLLRLGRSKQVKQMAKAEVLCAWSTASRKRWRKSFRVQGTVWRRPAWSWKSIPTARP